MHGKGYLVKRRGLTDPIYMLPDAAEAKKRPRGVGEASGSVGIRLGRHRLQGLAAALGFGLKVRVHKVEQVVNVSLILCGRNGKWGGYKKAISLRKDASNSSSRTRLKRYLVMVIKLKVSIRG